MGIPPQTACHEPIDSFDFALTSVRERVSRVLHDDVGPSLCAAGLHLDLLSACALSTEARDSAAGLREALDAALTAVRALLVEHDDRLLARGGLDGALTALAAHGLIHWTEPETPCAWNGAAQGLGFRMVRDWGVACAQRGTPLKVCRTEAALRMSAGATPAAWLAGWRHLAPAAGVLLEWTESDQGHVVELTPASLPPNP